ncbi:response regulator, partial [Leptolyngbya sp. 'hensonii']|uniref:response regulator n=1 Tax=Leptolyngbya sp. 'hensonii' TaxID=1922337 RepID=UPI00117E4F98
MVIRVLIAADSAISRAGLEAILVAEPALTVVGQAIEPAALVRQIEQLEPDVILLSLGLQEEEPLATWLNFSIGDDPAIVVLTDDLQEPWIGQALRIGLRAVLPREVNPEALLAAVIGAATGLVILHPSTLEVFLPIAR